MNPNVYSSALMCLMATLMFGVSLWHYYRLRWHGSLAYALGALIIAPGYGVLTYQYFNALPLTAAPFIRLGVGILIFAILAHHIVDLLQGRHNES